MKRRIYWSFLGVILPAVMLLAILLSFFFYTVARNREMAAVKDCAGLAAGLWNNGVTGGLPGYAGGAESIRMTVVTPDGMVLLDTAAVDGAQDNHGGRTEIIAAFQDGAGESVRYSDTLKTETYYYAVRLNDGSALRLSKTVGSITGAFLTTVPAVFFVTLLVFLFADLLAHRLTKKIIEPFGRLDMEDENEPVYDELLPFIKKIAAQKREITAQVSALQTRADTIAAITENMQEGIILLDRNGTVLTASKSVYELFGDTAGQNILRVCREIEFQQGVKHGLSGGNTEILFERGGKMYSVFFSPVHNEVGGAVILFFDVTGRYEAEKQRKEFSANVSHELKTPLTSISAFSEMIENGMVKDGDIQSFGAKISGQAKRLIHLIEDIIKLSEFDEGKASREQEVFDLYELAEAVTDALRENGRGVEVILTGERFSITANRRMIDELLYNLIDNGIKYNRDGGVVTVTLSLEDGLCTIAVSDTGIGIPAEHQSRVFERFYRVDKSRSKKTGGTGLGLSIVKHIAEYHGGGVELKSTGGVGTTVTCRIRSGA
ncbi:MAG: hypothetical protein LBH95_06825 [Oscillospiraceae bacterium]|jgi:two-component system phosphate regulon sensor histidine kinase PhoR|nr:hypothetical protein [Oscillospiraceae bacterium]